MTYLTKNKKYTLKNIVITFFIMVSIIAAAISTPAKPSPTVESSRQVEQNTVHNKTITPYDERQINCLARNAYFEAGNQSERGMIAVTSVVMNRTKDSRFPDTPCAVIRQKNHGVCQFSWVCQGKNKIRDADMFRRARAAAERVYLNKVYDVTHGGLFYHAKYVHPRWNLTQVASIGAHIFYRG
jgi:spore germination cell wall hydrolase CwlJ-like protein